MLISLASNNNLITKKLQNLTQIYNPHQITSLITTFFIRVSDKYHQETFQAFKKKPYKGLLHSNQWKSLFLVNLDAFNVYNVKESRK